MFVQEILFLNLTDYSVHLITRNIISIGKQVKIEV